MIKKIVMSMFILVNSSYAIDDVSIMDLKETVYYLMDDAEVIKSAGSDCNASIQKIYSDIQDMKSKIKRLEDEIFRENKIKKIDEKSSGEYKPANILIKYLEEY